ncbi:winged helix-turn-helix domain-containing protein [Arthrobacter sp. CJ23]|uniref:winged helix-turn-helix domain-containing protein n=1 Tax=Arthrobacter sp. CJ23 TaxID=2972479 RepID=UPI00215D343E|nr:winged helix-turn-helix domain-containing protein [Arthrobacter sp. CJ23]UVJ40133.1 winged helix-turn-helix domain-containing protein [Arthrobacter sp. CJ23]
MPVPPGYPSSSVQGNNMGEEEHQAFYRRRPDEKTPAARSARGFALFVGIDEAVAQSAGTSLCGLAKDIRDYGHALVDGLDSHVAVALGPPGGEGSPIQSVFAAFGDPSALARPRRDIKVPLPSAVRPPAIQPRRAKRPAASGVLIDVSARKVYLDGESVHLTIKEFRLMTYLIDNRARIVGRAELLQHIWGHAAELPNERAIDIHVRRLRSKLGRLARTIQTRRGAGYQFRGDPELTVCTAPEYMI